MRRYWSGLLVVLVVVGCRSTPQTSRLTVDDFQEVTARMAESLRHADAIAERTPESEPWVVSFHKLENLSDEVLTRGESWGVVAAVRAAQPINTLWYDKRIAFVIPAEYAIDQRGTLDAERADKGFGSERGVTHTITATLQSIKRAGHDSRTDLYAWEFELLDLRTGRRAWVDRFEFKRAAKGSIRD